VLANGEPFWDTTTNQLYVGDGATYGGVATSAGGGHTHPSTEVLQLVDGTPTTVQSVLATKSAVGHGHGQSEVSGLVAALAAKVETSLLATSTTNNPTSTGKIPQTKKVGITDGKLDDSFGGVSGSLATLSSSGGVAVVVQDPKSADVDSGNGKIPKAQSNGKLKSGWGGAADSLATLDSNIRVKELPAAATPDGGNNMIPMSTTDGKLKATWGGGANGLATTNSVGAVVQLPAAALALGNTLEPNRIPLTRFPDGRIDPLFIPIFAGGANIGIVPHSVGAPEGTYLRKDGTWQTPPGTGGGGSIGSGEVETMIADRLTNVPNVPHVPVSQKGASGGVASLGSDGKVPSAQLPTSMGSTPTFERVTIGSGGDEAVLDIVRRGAPPPGGGKTGWYALPVHDLSTEDPYVLSVEGHLHLISDTTGLQTALDGKAPAGHTHAYIPTSEKGANSGVATLGADGKIPSAQLPPSSPVPKRLVFRLSQSGEDAPSMTVLLDTLGAINSPVWGRSDSGDYFIQWASEGEQESLFGGDTDLYLPGVTFFNTSDYLIHARWEYSGTGKLLLKTEKGYANVAEMAASNIDMIIEKLS